jgi:hypothetical protein
VVTSKELITYSVPALTLSSEYYSKNDYAFYPGAKDSVKYDDVATNFSGLFEDLKVNKPKYQKEWDEERKTMIDNNDKSIDEYNKMKPKEKAKFNQTINCLCPTTGFAYVGGRTRDEHLFFNFAVYLYPKRNTPLYANWKFPNNIINARKIRKKLSTPYKQMG